MLNNSGWFLSFSVPAFPNEKTTAVPEPVIFFGLIATYRNCLPSTSTSLLCNKSNQRLNHLGNKQQPEHVNSFSYYKEILLGKVAK